MTESALWIALVAAVAATFVGACNIALKTFSRARLSEMFADRGHPERFDTLIRHRQKLVLMSGALRACLHLVVLAASLAFFEQRFVEWPPHWHYAAAFGVAGLLVTVFGVSIPGSWAHYHGETLLARAAPTLEVMLVVLRPAVAALEVIDPVVRRVTGAGENGDGDSEISEEVLSVVEAHDEQGEVHADQKEMLEAVFEFTSTTVGEIMTPRTDVMGLEVTVSLEQIKESVLTEGHSRIPVYEENLDQILGVLYVKDLIQYLNAPAGQGFELRTVLREALLIPESKPVRELLEEFKARKVHLAIVLDEYGGTAGLVTIEDILEELVGEIQDEYEPAEEEPTVRPLPDQEGEVFEVDARVHIDDLNDEIDLEIPEDEDFDTVGGFVCSVLGRIPEPGESFEQDGVRFEIIDAERTKVRKVHVRILETSDRAADASEPV